MLQHLSSPPPYTTPAQHAELTSSTPSSFAEIPPLLHWSDEDVEVILNPSSGWNGWDGRVSGTLWVTEEAVSFLPSTSSQTHQGFTLTFPALTLHALTPATEEGPAHLYCQVDESDAPPSISIIESNGNGHVDGTMNGVDGDDEYGDGDDYTPMREIRIYLAEAKLQPLFQALSDCSALHASLLPNGEPSSFFGFGDQMDGPDDQGDWEDDDEEPEDDQGGRIDPVERFMGLVDWGGVAKPEGWEEQGQYDDVDKYGEGDEDEGQLVTGIDGVKL
ncbi:regulator of volume decrease after cellular swelling-domain-containing protein [Naematelia encephala]|uniref:Regulator of volume decrease after cellular swelling-domain-containing protein n=1 Tax=Naematelia encephala TaxID=71784 RepID=A0A1Y2B2N5_9TREE|nr:regulator of volume decrease after cellular swelling-domain-containing protein [Naematelia encephala]